jgi:undecaprenyl-diphosphatase
VSDINIVYLGVIQGIGEILPISSSVNLYFFSKILNIQSFSFFLKIALHFGSFITLLIYFRKELKDIAIGLLTKRKKLTDTYVLQLFAGTLPVVTLGIVAKRFIQEFDSPKVMGIFCAVFGLLLIVFDKLACKNSRKVPVTLTKAFIIGVFQAMAVFPGISRLGICITAARMLSISRKNAIHFSLLLVIPSIFGSIILELFQDEAFSTFNMDVLYGVLITAVIGILVIVPCIRYMERCGFVALGIYRAAIGLGLCFI